MLHSTASLSLHIVNFPKKSCMHVDYPTRYITLGKNGVWKFNIQIWGRQMGSAINPPPQKYWTKGTEWPQPYGKFSVLSVTVSTMTPPSYMWLSPLSPPFIKQS